MRGVYPRPVCYSWRVVDCEAPPLPNPLSPSLPLSPILRRNFLQADSSNHLIRRIVLSSGLVSTLAGTSGISGSANEVGTAASFFSALGVAIDAAGTVALIVSGV